MLSATVLMVWILRCSVAGVIHNFFFCFRQMGHPMVLRTTSLEVQKKDSRQGGLGQTQRAQHSTRAWVLREYFVPGGHNHSWECPRVCEIVQSCGAHFGSSHFRSNRLFSRPAWSLIWCVFLFFRPIGPVASRPRPDRWLVSVSRL